MQLRDQEGVTDSTIDEALADPANKLWGERPGGDPNTYVYYQPVFAKQECIGCHIVKARAGPLYLPELKVGDLAAICPATASKRTGRSTRRASSCCPAASTSTPT